MCVLFVLLFFFTKGKASNALLPVKEQSSLIESVYEPFRDAWAIQLNRLQASGDYHQSISAFIPQLCTDSVRCMEHSEQTSQNFIGDCLQTHQFLSGGPWLNEHVSLTGHSECPAYLQNLAEFASLLARATAVEFCDYEAPATLVIKNSEGQLEKWASHTKTGWELRVRLVRISSHEAQSVSSKIYSVHAAAVVLKLEQPQVALSTLLVINACVVIGLRTPRHAILKLIEGTCVWQCRQGSLRTPWNAIPEKSNSTSTSNHMCRPFPSSFVAAEFALDLAVSTPITQTPAQQLLNTLDALAAQMEQIHSGPEVLVALQVESTKHAESFDSVVRSAAGALNLGRGTHRLTVQTDKGMILPEYGGLLRIQGLFVRRLTNSSTQHLTTINRQLRQLVQQAFQDLEYQWAMVQVVQVSNIIAHAMYVLEEARSSEAPIQVLTVILLLLLAIVSSSSMMLAAS